VNIAFGNYVTAQTNQQLVAPRENRIIRVTRVLLVAFGAVNYTLLSDPSGVSTDLTPPLYISNGNPLDMQLGRSFALTTARGAGLGLTTRFPLNEIEHSIVVWYEMVD
jgi:hypothetical protein